MDGEEIRAVRLARPFVPFTLELDDGRLLPVEQPYLLAISPDGNEISYGRVDHTFDHLPPRRVVRIHSGLVTSNH